MSNVRKDMRTPKASELCCTKVRGGKHALWNAQLKDDKFFDDFSNIIGSGSTADLAIKDFQAQWRRFR